jgi:small-conductance mechanosensitive channel
METLVENKLQILLIAIAIVVLIILMMITKRVTRKVTLVKKLDPNRRKVVLNAFYFVYYLIFIAAMIFILGIRLEDVAVFFSSVIALLGVAFFAQWSLLSNLTASIIIFFYHPMKIGDRIRIMDAEFKSDGVVQNITGFYTMIEMDNGRSVSMPNSLILQKGIEFVNYDSENLD